MLISFTIISNYCICDDCCLLIDTLIQEIDRASSAVDVERTTKKRRSDANNERLEQLKSLIKEFETKDILFKVNSTQLNLLLLREVRNLLWRFIRYINISYYTASVQKQRKTGRQTGRPSGRQEGREAGREAGTTFILLDMF